MIEMIEKIELVLKNFSMDFYKKYLMQKNTAIPPMW